MAIGNWADWQIIQLASDLGEKRPKREWFRSDSRAYGISMKSWSHITSKILCSMKLEERQMLIFIHHLGIEHVGVETFDPSDGVVSDYKPSEEYTKL